MSLSKLGNTLSFSQTSIEGLESISAGLLASIIVFAIIIVLVSYIYGSVCTSKLLKKSGYLKPWHGWVPILSNWRLFELAGKPGWWSVISYTTSLPIVGYVTALVALVLWVLTEIDLGKSFGKSSAFTVGLIFLPFPFYAILAFDNSVYIGPAGKSNAIGTAEAPVES